MRRYTFAALAAAGIALGFVQTASAADIDRIFRTCFEHKMGPLETADLEELKKEGASWYESRMRENLEALAKALR